MPQIARPADGGMMYAETNLSHTFPEPLNTITSGLFLILAIFWLIKLKGFDKRHKFLSGCAWLLLIGSIGGTTYHGLRRWSIFIMMDWMPIMLLCLAASVYFWIRALGKWYYGLLVFIAFGLVEFFVRRFIMRNELQLGININYGVMALMVLLPILVLLIRQRWQNGRYILVGLAAFTIALFFRATDSSALLPLGTHFLWHTFGVIAAASMFMFIYEVERVTLRGSNRT
ncbi:hypothetical protein GS399_11170 [Pedobacter sp. HMF7647]|uniref:Ceramidase n=1 Tax=Hufsiella arboris TaxID=2695275 RepID=A0A7K1YAD1_9SPHI|nr:hypothetical protein [Hufsiella arboris]MXV51532.1 hypothetical protein [Hufsiella arboris]